MPYEKDNAPRDRVADILDLEVFLFGGMPERPDPVFGRDANDSVLTRTTRAHICHPVAPASVQGAFLREVYIDINTLEILKELPITDSEDPNVGRSINPD